MGGSDDPDDPDASECYECPTAFRILLAHLLSFSSGGVFFFLFYPFIAPGVRVRLCISFSSAQRLTRASESPGAPTVKAVLVGPGWDTALRAGLDSRCAPWLSLE